MRISSALYSALDHSGREGKFYMEKKVTSALHLTFTAPGCLISSPAFGCQVGEAMDLIAQDFGDLVHTNVRPARVFPHETLTLGGGEGEGGCALRSYFFLCTTCKYM